METRKTLGIHDNLIEALSPVEDDINKIVSFLKHINTYNLILENRWTFVVEAVSTKKK